jgi:hypothetical protein
MTLKWRFSFCKCKCEGYIGKHVIFIIRSKYKPKLKKNKYTLHSCPFEYHPLFKLPNEDTEKRLGIFPSIKDAKKYAITEWKLFKSTLK